MVEVGGRAGREKSVLLEREECRPGAAPIEREEEVEKRVSRVSVCVTSCALRAPVESEESKRRQKRMRFCKVLSDSCGRDDAGSSPN